MCSTHFSLFFFSACLDFSPKSLRFHPGIWLSKKWSCCKSLSRTALGCQVATQWPETNNNPTTSSSKSTNNLSFFLLKFIYLSFGRLNYANTHTHTCDCLFKFVYSRNVRDEWSSSSPPSPDGYNQQLSYLWIKIFMMLRGSRLHNEQCSTMVAATMLTHFIHCGPKWYALADIFIKILYLFFVFFWLLILLLRNQIGINGSLLPVAFT